MKKSINSDDLKSDVAIGIATSIISSAELFPMELSLSVLNGLTMALVRYITAIKSNAELSDEDGLEKLVLSWLSAMDIKSELNFSKYISKECINLDIDINNL